MIKVGNMPTVYLIRFTLSTHNPKSRQLSGNPITPVGNKSSLINKLLWLEYQQKPVCLWVSHRLSSMEVVYRVDPNHQTQI